jgi:hypothetical protein
VGVILGILGWFNIQKSTRIIYDMHTLRTKVTRSSQQIWEKGFDKIQHPFMTKHSTN